MKDILGIQNVCGIKSYLSILESLEGSKTQIFGFLQNILYNKLKDGMLNIWEIEKRDPNQISRNINAKLCNIMFQALSKTGTSKLTSMVWMTSKPKMT